MFKSWYYININEIIVLETDYNFPFFIVGASQKAIKALNGQK